MKSSYEGTYIAADGHRYPDGEGPAFDGPVRPWATGRRKQGHLREDPTPQPVVATLDGNPGDPAEDERGFWEPQGTGRPRSGSLITEAPAPAGDQSDAEPEPDAEPEAGESDEDRAAREDAEAKQKELDELADALEGVSDEDREALAALSDDERDELAGLSDEDLAALANPEPATTPDGEPTTEDLLGRLDELQRKDAALLAERLGVEHPKSATGADIIAAIKTHQENA